MATCVLETAGHCRVARKTASRRPTETERMKVDSETLGGSLFAEGTREDCNTPQTRL